MRAEEARTQKKINDTKKRTQEIERLQKRNEDRQADKEREQELQRTYERFMAQKNYNMSHQAADHRNKIQHDLYKQRTQEATESKAERMRREN